MKKLLVYAAVAGVMVGFYYLLCISSKPMEEKTDSEPQIKDKTTVEEPDTEKSAQFVSERHTEAAGIMADAFANIMKDIEPVELDEESAEAVVDTKDAEIINELDSLSDELDELLK